MFVGVLFFAEPAVPEESGGSQRKTVFSHFLSGKIDLEKMGFTRSFFSEMLRGSPSSSRTMKKSPEPAVTSLQPEENKIPHNDLHRPVVFGVGFLFIFLKKAFKKDVVNVFF